MERDILDYDEEAPKQEEKQPPRLSLALGAAVGMVLSVALPWFRLNDVHLLNPTTDAAAVRASTAEAARELANLGPATIDAFGFAIWPGWVGAAAALLAVAGLLRHRSSGSSGDLRLAHFGGWASFLVGIYAFVWLRHTGTTLGLGSGHMHSALSAQLGAPLFLTLAALYLALLRSYPLWLKELVYSWGPAVMVVLVMRNSLAEPFRIPSGSMVPTLQIGDHILVSKITYGLKLPYTDWEIIPFGEPERGDVVVFRYPEQPAVDYIKRIVGTPGDTIEVRNDELYINGERATQSDMESKYNFVDQRCNSARMDHYVENLAGVEHHALDFGVPIRFSNYSEFTVPEGYYFMMGDNRHNSMDSRAWGLVPRDFIKGKANWIWLSYDRCEGNLPVFGSLRLDRLGASVQ